MEILLIGLGSIIATGFILMVVDSYLKDFDNRFKDEE